MAVGGGSELRPFFGEAGKEEGEGEEEEEEKIAGFSRLLCFIMLWC